MPPAVGQRSVLDPHHSRAGQGNLFRKYVVIFVALVTGALLASGVLEIYFSYQENQTALLQLQREKAIGAANRIEQFIKEVQGQTSAAIQLPPGTGAPTLDQRRSDYLRLLRQAPAITELSHLDTAGKEQLRVSRLAMNVSGSQNDYSQEPKFLEPRAGRVYFSGVYFRNESEPYMTIALTEGGPDAGVTVAEVNLKFIWDVVSQIKIGQSGYAYVVDSRGQLIAHPDISLVLQKTDLSSLPQVQAALSSAPRARGSAASQTGLAARSPAAAESALGDATGSEKDAMVTSDRLVAYDGIDPPGWSVFVEQPLEEAFAPIRASVIRTLLLLLLGLGLAVLASLFLARRMVTPIRALQDGAASIGAGALGQRIEVRTGDELEALAEQFNTMAVQLRESYANLERKVDERTRDLSEALEQLKALGEVSQAVNSSLDLQYVLTTIVSHAVQLSATDAGAIYEFDEANQAFELRATHGMSDELIEVIQDARIHIGETVVGQAAERREAVQTPDILDEPASPLRQVLERAGVRALLAVPLLREDRIVGALVVRRREPGSFADTTVDLVQTFATQSVLAIQNARLFQEIEIKSRELEVASRHKSEFLANMSHELRTPLNAIIGFSEVLIERMFGELNDKQDEYLQDILSSGRHLLSLINDILDLSKVEAGRMELELGEFSLPEALGNGLTMVKERASRHGIALSLDIEPTIETIEADERKVKQVVFNLLTNAVKFTTDGGRVELSARLADSPEVLIAVKDTGIGIAVEDQERIFEEFRQAGQSAARGQEGTGLGLALTRKFVELHGGRIWVESEVGAGSTFTFALPLRAPASSVPGPPPGPLIPVQLPSAKDAELAVPGERANGPTVLLVEDDPHSVDLLTLYLNAAGFSVAVAHDGDEGLELARRIRPVGITLDILLPRVDGWEFLTRAKADPVIADIPVVIVSMLDERGKGFALGAAGYLVKPIRRDDLLATLQRVAPRARTSARILAIDDDPMAIELIEAILRPEGFSVFKASSGEEGIALARRERPALVILDLIMPEMDGFTVVERLRADPTTADIPIVILTSRAMSEADKERLNGQISHLAEKGEFDREAFVALIRGSCPALSLQTPG